MNKLVYTEQNDLRIYESMPANDFKEFFMAYFKYKKGDKINIDDFTNPMTFAMFCQYIPKLDKMEDSYNKKVQVNKENGKKGGRPKKSALENITTTEFDIPKITEETIHETEEDMGTYIGKIDDNTNMDFEPDNYSDTLHKLLDDYQYIIEHTTDAIAQAEINQDIMVVYRAKEAKRKLREISEKLINDIDSNNFNKYIDEKVTIKVKLMAA